MSNNIVFEEGVYFFRQNKDFWWNLVDVNDKGVASAIWMTHNIPADSMSGEWHKANESDSSLVEKCRADSMWRYTVKGFDFPGHLIQRNQFCGAEGPIGATCGKPPRHTGEKHAAHIPTMPHPWELAECTLSWGEASVPNAAVVNNPLFEGTRQSMDFDSEKEKMAHDPRYQR